jgi:hypothetical protein
MPEPLSEAARIALAFVRGHPGRTFEEIQGSLGIGMERTICALRELIKHKLIVVHKIPSHPSQTDIKYSFVFYSV